jgi:hypothetical protein
MARSVVEATKAHRNVVVFFIGCSWSEGALLQVAVTNSRVGGRMIRERGIESFDAPLSSGSSGLAVVHSEKM